jgi:hypothetical protein
MEGHAMETRWLVLGTDGRHVTLGRHSDPSPEEIKSVEAALAANGQSGWLAVLNGSYYRHRGPALMMVRPLCNPKRSFADAAAAFEAARKEALDTLK